MAKHNVHIPYQIIAVFGHNYLDVDQKGNVQYICPKCVERKGTPDREGHLYVHTKTLAYHCYRCDYKGHINRYQKVNENKVYEEERDLALEEMLGDITKIVEPDSQRFGLKIPIDKVTTSSSATKYLLERGFTYEQMEYYDMRVGNLEQEFGRIIIPNQVQRMVYTDTYSARSYIGQDPKYHNPSDIKKSEVVFNLHRIQEGSPIILVEGALTAIAAGYRGVASLGKNLSNTQASLIAKKKPSVVYVNFDFGAEHESREACRLLRRVLPDTPIFEVLMKDERDAADMTHEEYAECLKNAIKYEPLYDDILNIVEGDNTNES